MRENLLKKKLQSGQTVFGSFVRTIDADVIELLALQGFDCLVFDGEHGVMEPSHCVNMARAAELHGVTPIARPMANLQPVILRYMDTGVHGILVPMINSAAEAEAVVASTKFAPQGNRGMALSRAADFGQRLGQMEHAVNSNEQTLVVVQIETTQAVEALPEIVKVEGVDVVFVGPSDLAVSLGLTGQFQNPKVVETIEHIAKVVGDSDKAFGLMVQNADGAKKWQAHGARFMTVTFESLVRSGCQGFLTAVR